MQRNIIWLYNIKLIDEHYSCYPTKKGKLDCTGCLSQFRRMKICVSAGGKDHILAALRFLFEPAIETL